RIVAIQLALEIAEAGIFHGKAVGIMLHQAAAEQLADATGCLQSIESGEFDLHADITDFAIGVSGQRRMQQLHVVVPVRPESRWLRISFVAQIVRPLRRLGSAPALCYGTPGTRSPDHCRRPGRLRPARAAYRLSPVPCASRYRYPCRRWRRNIRWRLHRC